MKKIICDHCGRDLSYTGNSEEYRLLLKVENVPSKEGSVTDMRIEPDIVRDYHFCNLLHLKKWSNGELYKII